MLFHSYKHIKANFIMKLLLKFKVGSNDRRERYLTIYRIMKLIFPKILPKLNSFIFILKNGHSYPKWQKLNLALNE